jgi:hypothetical protein
MIVAGLWRGMWMWVARCTRLRLQLWVCFALVTAAVICGGSCVLCGCCAGTQTS